MSRAKKTKASKERSRIGLYRQIGNRLNHAKKVEKQNNCEHELDSKGKFCTKCKVRMKGNRE